MRCTFITPLALGALLAACGPERSDFPSSPAIEAVAQAGRSSWEWSEPVWLGPVVNSPARDLNPELSPDGLSLYFTSFRDGTADIYVSQRASESCTWGAPVKLPPPINGDANQFSPDISPDGHHLYFGSSGHGGFGNGDLFVSYREDPTDDFGWGPPVNLGPAVNTEVEEQGPQFVAAGGGTLYFNRQLMPTRVFAIPMTIDGLVSGEAAAVDELNHPTANTSEVAVRADGRELFFWSPRPGTIGGTDIFVSTRPTPKSPWSVPRTVGRPVNHEGSDLVVALSTDGKTMILSTGRPGGLGLPFPDLWMSVRSADGTQVPDLGGGSGCPAP
jgi:hypothetical protein